MKVSGKCSFFGGPFDTGVAPDEGLAFIYEVEQAPELFLPEQPPNTSGLARRLHPGRRYVACRWDYDQYPKDELRNGLATVRCLRTGKVYHDVHPADWGPHVDTDRVADLSPGLMIELGVATDDEVEVVYPAETTPSRTPVWLIVMRAITGATEGEADEDNPKILAMADYIGWKYPEMKSYCSQYTHDDIAWCGLTVAFCCAVADKRPPFGPVDTDCFLWAQSFAYDNQFYSIPHPQPGAIVVMTREGGGGHVTLFEREEDGLWICRGGNQSDSVKESSYDPSTVIAVMWPK